jgi:hypothetical protein
MLKVLEIFVQMKAARLMEMLSGNPSTDRATPAAPPQCPISAAIGAPRDVYLGRNILEDLKTVSIGQSAYFTGASSCPRASAVFLNLRMRGFL